MKFDILKKFFVFLVFIILEVVYHYFFDSYPIDLYYVSGESKNIILSSARPFEMLNAVLLFHGMAEGFFIILYLLNILIFLNSKRILYFVLTSILCLTLFCFYKSKILNVLPLDIFYHLGIYFFICGLGYYLVRQPKELSE